MTFFGQQDVLKVAFLAEDRNADCFVIYQLSQEKLYLPVDEQNEILIEKKVLCPLTREISDAFSSIVSAYELPFENGIIFHNKESIFTLRKGKLEDVRVSSGTA